MRYGWSIEKVTDEARIALQEAGIPVMPTESNFDVEAPWDHKVLKRKNDPRYFYLMNGVLIYQDDHGYLRLVEKADQAGLLSQLENVDFSTNRMPV